MPSDPFVEDRATSPVIGVILMVAIVVILSISVGGFAFVIADSVGSSPPNVAVEFDYKASTDTLTVIHSSGEILTTENTGSLTIGGTEQNSFPYGSGDTLGTVSSASTIETVNVVWAAPNGGTSYVLSTWNSPTGSTATPTPTPTPTSAPSTAFNFEYRSNPLALFVYHESGDELNATNTGLIEISVSRDVGIDGGGWTSDVNLDPTAGDANQAEVEGPIPTAGGKNDIFNGDVDNSQGNWQSGDVVEIIWHSPDGSQSEVLDTFTIP